MSGRDDDGTAVVEFVLLAVVLLVPFVYAVLCVFTVERAAFTLAAATREAGRAYVTAPDGASAEPRASAAADLVFDDHDLTAPVTTRIVCTDRPCLSPGARVTVDMSVAVPLPLVPHWGGETPASVVVRARHDEVVDLYREARP